MLHFAFFPTPYPDEILYSIVCRYHIRSGNTGATTTIRELWGRKGVAKSLYLPSGLHTITNHLPENTGITLDNLIWEHTMYPYVYPALTKQRADSLYSILCGIEKKVKSTYQKAGLIGRTLDFPKYLRFCPLCIESDHKQYGEAYWHRIHQLPGVCICPKHNERIYDSPFFIHLIFRDIFPASIELCNYVYEMNPFSFEMGERHLAFAEDSEWILKNGKKLGNAEEVYDKYLRLMVVKGYRKYESNSSQVDYRMLNQSICAFYGSEFLKSLNAYDEDDYSSWAARFTWRSCSKPPTSQHILMMRFLAGSPQQFADSSETFLPFGESPWVCRNKVCEYYLKDCIDKIEVKVVDGFHKADFLCPHCGFNYHRGKAR